MFRTSFLLLALVLLGCPSTEEGTGGGAGGSGGGVTSGGGAGGGAGGGGTGGGDVGGGTGGGTTGGGGGGDVGGGTGGGTTGGGGGTTGGGGGATGGGTGGGATGGGGGSGQTCNTTGISAGCNASAAFSCDVATSCFTTLAACLNSPQCGGAGTGGGTGGGAGTAAIGDGCTADADCGTGLLCDTTATGGYCYGACTTAGSCPSGATCIGGGTAPDGSPIDPVCVKVCTTTADCRTDYICDPAFGATSVCAPKCVTDADCGGAVCDTTSGQCVEPVNVGNACTDDTSCGIGLVCATGPGAPNGYCTRDCSQVDCPTGSSCVSFSDSSALCLKDCATVNDCRSGYYCPAGSCEARCQTSADCGPGTQCQVATGACIEAGPVTAAIGAACAMDTDCTSGTCFDQAATSFPGGMCTASCETVACPSGSLCAGTGPTAACLFPCTSTSDCRTDYVCANYNGQSGVCVPQCTNVADLCNTPSEVCLPSGVCAPAPVMTPMVGVSVTNPASFMAPVTTASTPLSVTVPSGAVSVQVVVDGPATSGIRIYRITGPGGVIYKTGGTANQMKVFNSSSNGALAVMVPNAPDVPFTPGTYTFEYKSTTTPVSLQPRVSVKTTNNAALTSATMDITFVFVGTHPVITNAAAAQTNVAFQQMVTTFKSVFAAGGVTVTNIEYLDAPAAVARQFADVASGDLGELMRTTAGLTNERPTVFFVQSISGGAPGFTLLGQSSGIPGGLKNGSGVAGVGMALYNFPNGNDNPTRLARTLTHEFGHWLGLFHATEMAGTSFDPLSDTAECPAATYDTNHNAVMTPAECLGHGADNLMFWTQDTALVSRDQISPNQKWVLLRNPASK